MSKQSKVLYFLMVLVVVLIPQTNQLSAQFYSVNFTGDQASLTFNDCGIANSTYNTCFGISTGIPNLIQISPASMLFIDVEGGNCTTGCGSDAGGDNLNFYETNPIDVSGQSSFTITANFAFWDYANFNNSPGTCGTVPANLESNPGCGLDMLAFRYSLDGGPWTDFDPGVPNATALGGGGGHQLSTAGCLSGNSVRIQVQFGSQSVAEGILIESIQLFEASLPTVITATETSVCFGETILFSEVGGVATTWQWLTPDGTGHTMNQSFSSPMLNGSNGWWSVITTDGSGCTGIDSILITVTPAPTANMGVDLTLCDQGGGIANFDLTTANASVSGGGGTVTWYTEASGTILVTDASNFPASNNTSVWARVTSGSCISDPVEVTLFVSPAPTADSGGPYSSCGSTPVNISGFVGGSATTGTWSTLGDGVFANPNLLTTTYNPGPSDIALGSVMITLTSDDAGGTCIPAMSSVLITIGPDIIANAGGPYSVCANQTLQLNGSVSGAGTNVQWTSLGDGVFDNPFIVNATYTPGLGDIGLGTATLTITGTDPTGVCPPASDVVNISITPAPSVNITVAPSEICGNAAFNLQASLSGSATSLTWSSGGDGIFSNPSSPFTSYTPGPLDILTGSISITVNTDDVNGTCSADSDIINIAVIDGPSVSIDPVNDICSGGLIALSATIGGTATNVQWNTLGDGNFSSPSLTFTNYQPGALDIALGSVTLEVTTDNVNGACVPATAQVVVTINPGPTINIDQPLDICSDQPIILNATLGGSASSVQWTSLGDGSFANATSANTVYSPGPGDIAAGSVTIIGTTDDAGGTCQAVGQSVDINIEEISSLNVDPAMDICTNDLINLSASFGGGATGVFWTTAGDGSFDNPTLTTPNYTPGTSDINAGVVSISVSTISANQICSEPSQTITVDILSGPTVSITGPTEICGNDDINLTATPTNNTGLNWTSSGDGSFSNTTANNTIYTSGLSDISIGFVTVYATVENTNLNCGTSIDSLVITVSEPVTAGTPENTLLICENIGSNIILSDLLNGETTGGSWMETSATPSTGSAFNPATGTFNSSGQIPGLYTFEYLVSGNSPCPADMETVSIEIVGLPSATVMSSTTTCDLSSQGSIVNFNGLITAGDPNGSWADTDGTSVDLSNYGAVDFDGIAPGIYTFTYTTNSATVPCTEVELTTLVTVEDCSCPSVATNPIPDFCSDNADFILSGYENTTESGSWAITGVPAGTNPATIAGLNFIGTNADPGIYSLTFTIDSAPLFGCPDSSVQNVVLYAPPNAGAEMQALDLCVPNSQVIILNDRISNEDNGGVWLETSTVPSTLGFDPIAGTFDPNFENTGQYIFEYQVDGNFPCLAANSEVIININVSPFADVSSGISVCNLTANGSVANFNLLLTGGDTNGTWADTDGTGVNLSDYGAVDFNSISVGSYTFTYTTNSASGNCQEAIYTTTIIVEDCGGCPSVATTGIPDFCTSDANFILNTYQLTSESGSWNITSTPVGSNPATISGSNFNGTNSDPGIYNLTFTLDAAPIIGCPDSSVQQVLLTDPPFSIVSTGTTVCNLSANGSIANFNLLITAGDMDGSWADTDGTGVNLSDYGAVDFNLVPIGNYTFTYTTNSATGNCLESSYTTTVTVEDCGGCPSVAVGSLPDLCSDNAILDLSGFVLTTEPGTWSITSSPAGSNPAAIAGSFFNGNSSDPGNYSLTFTLDAAPILNCPDSAVTTLNVFTPTNSGTATFSFFSCNTDNTPIDLSQFLFGADLGGTWSETSLVGSTGTAFNSSNASFNAFNQIPGIYNFTYSVAPNGTCAGSNTEFTVIVEAGLSASLLQLETTCNATTDGSVLDFNALILTGSTIGTWIDVDGTGVTVPPSGMADFNGIAPGSYTYSYVLPAGQTCPGQTYSTTVVVEDCSCPSPITDMVPDACSTVPSIDLSLYNIGGQTGVWTVDNTNGLSNPTIAGNVMNLSSGEPGDYQLTFTLAGGPYIGCPDSSVINFSILSGVQTIYNPDICADESVLINGTIYDASLTTGTEIFGGGAANGCDSTVFVNLNVVNTVQLPQIDTTICFGESFELYGVTFDASNPSQTIPFQTSGCDSFLLITTNFHPEAIGNFNSSLCSGESITIGGIVFDENMSVGQAVIPSGSVMGCDSTVMVNIVFDSNVTSSITALESVCLGDSSTINFNFNSASLFDITFSINGNNFSLSGIEDGHQEVILLPADATILITSANAIGSTCTVNTPLTPLEIEVIDVDPTANVLTDYNGFDVSCYAESDAEVMLDILGGNAPYQLTWDGPEPDLNNLGAGFYSATVQDGQGCRDSLAFTINEPDETQINLTIEDVNCPENQDGVIIISDIQGAGSTYFFSLDNSSYAAIPSLPFQLQGLGAGSGELFIEDENQCGTSANFNIAVDNNLQTDISPDATLELGDSLAIEVDPNFVPTSINWSPANTLSCSNCLNPVASPTETTTYRVVLEDESGCIVEETIELRVKRTDVYIPNAFSPNADGNNDIFYVQSSNDNLIIEQFIIVDRWGEIVFQAEDFEPNDINLGWDGRLKNEYLNPGVFVYYLQIKYPNGNLIPMKGDITLLR